MFEAQNRKVIANFRLKTFRYEPSRGFVREIFSFALSVSS